MIASPFVPLNGRLHPAASRIKCGARGCGIWELADGAMPSPRSRARTAYSDLARRSGLSRPGIYKALGEDGNPSFETIRSILSAMGLRLTVVEAA